MSRKCIAIACQGGGSQCAFVAGALKTLFRRGVHRRFNVVGLSGTSGGALTAAVAWMGLLKQAKGDQTPIEDRIMACWNDLTARTPQEIVVDRFGVELLRLIEHGVLPSVAMSPSSPMFRFWSRALGFMIGRPEFTDLRALLDKHLRFEELPVLVAPDSPVLLVGASDVLDGSFKIFSSAHCEIDAESLLASAAIPNLFPAVPIAGHYYWDGIFASNPPIVAFLRAGFMGKTSLPDEIWIIQVNRAEHDIVPERPCEITDRRNHLAGNLSMQHELGLIAMVNMLFQERALTDRFRARFGLNTTETIQVRFIRMSEGLHDLDYPSKLSREPSHIARLVADGEAQANTFLSDYTDVQPEDEPELDVGPAPFGFH